MPAAATPAAARTLPPAIVRRDQSLTKSVAVAKQRVEDRYVELRALRYQWCVTEGWTYAEYGQQVGVSPSAVYQSVVKHAVAHDLPITSDAVEARRVGTQGRPRKGGVPTAPALAAYPKPRAARAPRTIRATHVLVKLSEDEKAFLVSSAKAKSMNQSDYLRAAIAAFAVDTRGVVTHSPARKRWGRRAAA